MLVRAITRSRPVARAAGRDRDITGGRPAVAIMSGESKRSRDHQGVAERNNENRRSNRGYEGRRPCLPPRVERSGYVDRAARARRAHQNEFALRVHADGTRRHRAVVVFAVGLARRRLGYCKMMNEPSAPGGDAGERDDDDTR